jgi:hypothetical protein
MLDITLVGGRAALAAGRGTGDLATCVATARIVMKVTTELLDIVERAHSLVRILEEAVSVISEWFRADGCSVVSGALSPFLNAA